MAKAIVDPGDLRRFAQQLKRFVEEVSRSATVLQGQFAGLGDTWRDQEHAKFAEEFAQTLIVMNRFGECARDHIPFLLRKAERIEEYLNQR